VVEDIARAVRGARAHAGAVVGYLALGLTGGAVERRTDFARCPHPVLLLHGFLATRQSLSVLERRLRRDGYGVFSFRLGGVAGRYNTRRIDELAELVRDKVECLYARHPGMGPLTVVGHSKGGLVAVYWVKLLGGHRRVHAVVTLGTPHRGTPLAWAGVPAWPVAPSILQMRPRSAFIRLLGRAPWPASVRLTSIYSRRDGLVRHPGAVLEAHAGGPVSNVEVDGTHRDFLLRRRIYDLVLRELRAAASEKDTRREPAPSAAA